MLLRHLYAWHLDILLLAVVRRKTERLKPVGEPAHSPPSERLNGLFASLVATSGNPEHAAALKSVMERLEPYQRFEREFLDAVEGETQQILAAIDAGDQKALRRSLVQYHRRRQQVVPEILERFHAA